MSTNLWTFLLLLANWAGSLAARSRVYITGKVGSTAVLSCNWKNILGTQMASPHVEWRTVAGIMFERRGEEMYQGEKYKGRADVPEDKLQEGDCSLVLNNVTHDDEGLYESFLTVRRTKRSLDSERVLLQSVELSVQDALQESLSENKAQRKEERAAGISHTSSWITYLFLFLNLLFYVT